MVASASSAVGGRVEVSDDGPKISADDLPYIFDRFYRSARGRALPGSGLGLAIVCRIADLHDGTVEAIPLQQGVKFRISILVLIARACGDLLTRSRHPPSGVIGPQT